MKHLLLLSLVAASFTASAQNNAISWNKVLTGVIGKYPATMYLQKTGKAYNGYYYYDNKQIPIRLTDSDSNADSIHISAYENNNAEYFNGVIETGIFKGEWKNIIDEKIAATLSFSFSENKPAIIPLFDVVFTEYATEYPAGNAKGNNPGFGYFAAALWPAAATPAPVANFFKRWVNGSFDRKNTVEPIGKFFISQKNKDVAEWRKFLQSEDKEAVKEDVSGHSVNTERRLLLMHQSEQYVSVADFSYEFSGGAHGNYGTGSTVLDVKKMKFLKLTDVFTPAGKEKLAPLLDAAARAKFNIAKGAKLNSDDGGELLVDKIVPNENFYLTGKGIGFIYTPYEIAAYAYGEINLFIPFEKLTGLLQPGFGK